MTEELKDLIPNREEQDVDDSVFLDPTARLVGDVMMSSDSSLLPGASIKGDKSEVEVGEKSIIMNDATIESTEREKTILGEESFVSPGARIKGARIGDNALVGLDAVILEGADIGEGSIVGTKSIVPEGMEVPENSLVMGQPAEVVREVSSEEIQEIKDIREHVVRKTEEFKIMKKRGEEFDVFDKPSRPDEMLEEFKEDNMPEDKEEKRDKKRDKKSGDMRDIAKRLEKFQQDF